MKRLVELARKLRMELLGFRFDLKKADGDWVIKACSCEKRCRAPRASAARRMELLDGLQERKTVAPTPVSGRAEWKVHLYLE